MIRVCASPLQVDVWSWGVILYQLASWVDDEVYADTRRETVRAGEGTRAVHYSSTLLYTGFGVAGKHT